MIFLDLLLVTKYKEKINFILFETKEDFYQAMNAFRHFANDNIKAYTTSKDDDYTLIVHDEISL